MFRAWYHAAQLLIAAAYLWAGSQFIPGCPWRVGIVGTTLRAALIFVGVNAALVAVLLVIAAMNGNGKAAATFGPEMAVLSMAPAGLAFAALLQATVPPQRLA
jgi:hypothetical protein